MKDGIEEKLKSKIKDSDVEARWSIKRIAIFSSIMAILLFGIFYYFQLKKGDVLGEEDMTSRTVGPQIDLPTRESINEILENAEEDISNINANDIISSQPQIQDAIKQLEKLSSGDNFKEVLCSVVCSN